MNKTALNCLFVIVAGLELAGPISVFASPGDLYESDRGTNTIFRFTPGGTKSTFVTGLNAPIGLVFDGQGNLYEADNGSNSILKFTPAGTQSIFVSGLNAPTGLAIDAQGNVFEADFGSGTINKITPTGIRSTFASGLSAPMGLAFDSSGNLYASDITGNTISKFTPAGVQSTFASGLNGPNGLVFDGSGNLYEAEYGPDTIFKITPAGTRTVFASHLDYPFSLAFNGNLFEGDFGHGLIYKFTSGGAKSIFASANQPEGLAFEPPIQFRVVATVPLPATASGAVAVNQALNKIYASGGPSSGQDVVVIDGTTFATTDLGAGSGSGANVDVKTDHYWAGTVSGGSVVVRDGKTNNLLATVSLTNCPISTTYDFAKNRIWVGAQCGNGSDPVFAIDANTFQVIPGTPVPSGGVMGPIIANGANGRLYLATGGVSKRINPTNFQLTTNAFGTVMAINTLTNKLYASSGNNLQIINGTPDPETLVTTIALSYSPASIGVSPPLGHLYLANPNANCLEVRNSSTGAVIATFPLSSFGVVPNGAMTVDSIRGRVYLIASSGTGPVLLVIEDLTNARNSSANLGF